MRSLGTKQQCQVGREAVANAVATRYPMYHKPTVHQAGRHMGVIRKATLPPYTELELIRPKRNSKKWTVRKMQL